MPCEASTSCWRAYIAAAARSMLRVKSIEPCRIGAQEILVLDPRRRVLVLDDQRGLREVDVEQLPGGELVVEPVHRAVLQVGERIVAGRARQLVLAQHGLLLPGVAEVGRVRRDLAVDVIAPQNGLAAVPPTGDAFACR